MRSKFLPTTAFLVALLMVGWLTPKASAQGWGWCGNGYYGWGSHDLVPHWHNNVTPFGSYSYYGLGAHDFFPHSHYYDPFYGGYSLYYRPYRVGFSFYNGYPYNYGNPYYYGW